MSHGFQRYGSGLGSVILSNELWYFHRLLIKHYLNKTILNAFGCSLAKDLELHWKLASIKLFAPQQRGFLFGRKGYENG